MTAPTKKRFDALVKTHLNSVKSGLAIAADDMARGFFAVTHNSFALLGLAVVFGVVTLTARPDLRDAGEIKLMAWLQERREPVLVAQAPQLAQHQVAPAPAESLSSLKARRLSTQQAAVASWISKKYSVAHEPVGALVAEAFEIGQKVKLDPTLILAIMAIESGFNPFAQSPVGAQGLMQVMTRVHHEKYAQVGGRLAAFDPVTNLRVGVKVLQECISRAGSIEGGLKYYVGAANLPSDGGYANKVMAERARLLAVVGGHRPSTSRLAASPARARPVPVSLPASAPVQAQEADEKETQDLALLEQS